MASFIKILICQILNRILIKYLIFRIVSVAGHFLQRLLNQSAFDTRFYALLGLLKTQLEAQAEPNLCQLVLSHSVDGVLAKRIT